MSLVILEYRRPSKSAIWHLQRVLRQYCEQNGIVDAEFYRDRGISGTKSSCLSLDRMMAALENDEVNSRCLFLLVVREKHHPPFKCTLGFANEKQST